MFGVNFADGRIKGYGLRDPRGRGEKTFYVLYVRGNPKYGQNDFDDNGDGTVTDRATGLTWMKRDSGHLGAGPKGDGAMTWEQALAWAEGLEHAGHSDWRLPNAKELQSIVDYTRSPEDHEVRRDRPGVRDLLHRERGRREGLPLLLDLHDPRERVRRCGRPSYVAFGTLARLDAGPPPRRRCAAPGRARGGLAAQRPEGRRSGRTSRRAAVRRAT